jgi:hypothetical protein
VTELRPAGYYSINLRQQRKLAENAGGRFTDKTHFVVAGGQVKSMLSWLGYMKLDATLERHWGMSADLDRARRPDRQGIGGPVVAEPVMSCGEERAYPAFYPRWVRREHARARILGAQRPRKRKE